MISPESSIRAINNTDTTFTVGQYTFHPGTSKLVTFLWMVNHYGDPRSIPGTPQVVKHPNSDQSMAVQPREIEIKRVNTIWGVPDIHQNWETIPHLEFFDNEDDSRIFTPFDDPTGQSTVPANTTVAGVRAYEERIANLEKTILMMSQATGVSLENLPFDVNHPEEPPVDESTPAKSSSPWADSVPLDMTVDTGT